MQICIKKKECAASCYNATSISAHSWLIVSALLLDREYVPEAECGRVGFSIEPEAGVCGFSRF